MKKNIVLVVALCSVLFVQSCKNTDDLSSSSPTEKVELISYAHLNTGKIIRESGINDFRLNKGNKTWKDVEFFYETLSKKYTNPSELAVVQATTAAVILDEYGLLQNTEKNVAPNLDKYIEVIRSTQFAPPSLYLKILKGVQNKWSKSKVNNLKGYFVAVSNLEKARIESNIAKHEALINSSETREIDKKIMRKGLESMQSSLDAIEQLKKF